MTVPDDALFVRNPAVTQTALDDDIVLVEPESGEVFYLDAVTGGLWRLFEEPASASEAGEAYRAAFPEQSGETIARDVEAAIIEMLSRGLLVRFE